MLRQLTYASAIAGFLLGAAGTAHAATFPFTDDFRSDPLTNPDYTIETSGSDIQWSYDAVNDQLEASEVAGGANAQQVGVATVELGTLGGGNEKDFKATTNFDGTNFGFDQVRLHVLSASGLDANGDGYQLIFRPNKNDYFLRKKNEQRLHRFDKRRMERGKNRRANRCQLFHDR
jgi:hypothetical protein